jgi:hypothetical protein
MTIAHRKIDLVDFPVCDCHNLSAIVSLRSLLAFVALESIFSSSYAVFLLVVVAYASFCPSSDSSSDTAAIGVSLSCSSVYTSQTSSS